LAVNEVGRMTGTAHGIFDHRQPERIDRVWEIAPVSADEQEARHYRLAPGGLRVPHEKMAVPAARGLCGIMARFGSDVRCNRGK